MDGLDIQQGTLFIPKPDDSIHYYLFHFSNDAPDSTRPWRIYYSLIDKLGNGGVGSVSRLNVPIMQGLELREGGMTACKHANGRDYWLIMGASVINTFYEFLVTPDTILGPFTQTIGCEFPGPTDFAYSRFSQDGSKFATGIAAGAPLLLMDFDRCSGTFSNPKTILNDAYTDSSGSVFSQSVSMEFSPNGRFLYVSNITDLNQYDLQDSDMQDSIELFRNNNAFYGIDMLQIAPNGKLYGSTWGGGLYAIHVVNAPDLKGDSADFVYGGQQTLTQNSMNLPNLINYNLGPLFGSGCDTIPTGIGNVVDNNLLRLIPNPADKYLYVEMGMQGNYEFDLLNITGQVIDKKETRQIDNFDTEFLASGTYFLQVLDKCNANKAITQKLVIQH
jgi:hypothetical protein